MALIHTQFFNNLFERDYFAYLIENKAEITISGSQALAFWASQKNIEFRDVKNSDIDIRCKNPDNIIRSLYNWIESERGVKTLKEEKFYSFLITSGRDLEYEGEDVSNLINLKARLLADLGFADSEIPLIDIFTLDRSQNNTFVWVQNGKYNFRVLSLEGCLEHKQLMFERTGKEKHQKDIMVFL
jgi:uncharacterized protein YjiS (DUF1127 family)